MASSNISRIFSGVILSNLSLEINTAGETIAVIVRGTVNGQLRTLVEWEHYGPDGGDLDWCEIENLAADELTAIANGAP